MLRDIDTKVRTKLADTAATKKKSGKDNYIYLLSHILFYEDGSGFSGQCAKNREYRYYHNRKHDLRIRCDEIHPVIFKRIKNYLMGHPQFAEMVEAAILRRQTELPKVESQITALQKEIQNLEAGEKSLRDQLLDPEKRGKSGFMEWLERQVEKLEKDRNQRAAELMGLERYTEEHGWVSWQHLQKLESGKNMNLSTIYHLSRLYKIHPSEILKDE